MDTFSFILWANILVAGLIFITLVIWITFRKKIKLLEDILEEQKKFYQESNSDKLVLEGELIKRTKQLHDTETLLEVRVAEKTNSLKNELARAKELANSKDEFIRITSHELRTPTDVVRGNLDMVLKGETGTLLPKTKEYIEDALLGTDRLASIVNDMLDISRIETGKLKFNFKDVNIKEIIDPLIKDFTILAEKKKLSLAAHVKKGLPKVSVDSEKVIQILDNLIGNAIKLTLKGSITVNAHEESDFLVVEVSDTGIGILEEDQPKLFEKFPQIDKSEAGNIKGTGLGLYICHRLVEKMGGRIWVTSSHHKGSTFRFSLPIAQSQKAKEILRLYQY